MALPNSSDISTLVSQALLEDLGSGDLTAQLVSPVVLAKARVISRESAMICGQAWVNETFHQVDPKIRVLWQVNEGAMVAPNTCLLELEGLARSVLSAERTALNFLQTLSGTATQTRLFVEKISHTRCRLLDTRKTIPGLRIAQKYATRCAGALNHRMGLFDAYLIKENHIVACGSIEQAVACARKLSGQAAVMVEVEVETEAQLKEALDLPVDRILLDNFTVQAMKKAVVLAAGKIPLEVSGNVSLENIQAIAETGVDFISVGALTKSVRAIDLSMRFF